MLPRCLFSLLEEFEMKNPRSASLVLDFKKLLQETPHPFSRDQYPGHLTGSCFVVNPEFSQILLMNHKKLGKWLQMGGHAEGESDIASVALREAWEEAGTQQIELVNSSILDIDIHLIPARKNEPEHFHYDVRFLAVCRDPQSIQKQEEECADLKWFSWEQAYEVAKEPSMHRVFKKVSGR